MKRMIPLVKTGVVLALFFALLFALRGTPFADWQKTAFGSAPVSSTLLFFVGFLEEFFFRGYLQSRLNDAFGRPFRVAGVRLGAGLFLSAACFGLLHPLTSTAGLPWPWALWTGAGGLLFGYLREQSGSVVASTVAHGLFVLPTAFFAP